MCLCCLYAQVAINDIIKVHDCAETLFALCIITIYLYFDKVGFYCDNMFCIDV